MRYYLPSLHNLHKWCWQRNAGNINLKLAGWLCSVLGQARIEISEACALSISLVLILNDHLHLGIKNI